jgi:hypothetical protein
MAGGHDQHSGGY